MVDVALIFVSALFCGSALATFLSESSLFFPFRVKGAFMQNLGFPLQNHTSSSQQKFFV